MKAKAQILAQALLVGAMALLSPASAEQNDADGRALYHGHAAFARGADATNLHLPPEFVACARCHGAFGEGGREGGVTAPALGWSALTTPRGEAPPFESEAKIVDAVTKGVARGGGVLGATMPRYALSNEETSALLAYLKRVGRSDDYPPGVDRLTIRLATALPLSGPSSDIGRAVYEGLREAFEAVNASGGLYGRKILLEAIDLAQSPDAIMAALSAQRPFAVVGGMWRAEAPISSELAKRHIAKIATLLPHKDASLLDEWDIDLLPPLDRQREAIENALRACKTPGPRWAVASDGERPSSLPVGQRWFASDAEIGNAFAQTSGAGCVAYGLTEAAALDALIPAAWEKRLVLPFPAALLASGGTDATSALWRALGRASARLSVELIARAGSRLNERSPLSALERSAGIELQAGAPARFDDARRYAWDPDLVTFAPGSAPQKSGAGNFDGEKL